MIATSSFLSSTFVSFFVTVAVGVSVGACGGSEDGQDRDPSKEESTEVSESALGGGYFRGSDFPPSPRRTCNGAWCVDESGKIVPNPDWPASPRPSERKDNWRD